MLAESRRPEDYDVDGMADAWERAHGLNPTDSRDQWFMWSDGYTNPENFLFR